MPPLAGVAEETLHTPDTLGVLVDIRTWHVKQSPAVPLSPAVCQFGTRGEDRRSKFFPVHAINALRFGGQLHSFSIYALDGSEWLASGFSRFTLRK